jgi:plastocyanin
MKLHRLSLLGTVVVVVVAAGCGGGNGSGSASSKPATTSGSPSTPTPSKTVTISETEYTLTPGSVSLPKAGTYEFKAVNKGTVSHALEIEGKGVEQRTSEISPGNSATVRVTFKSNGSYEMFCPVDGHRARGMQGTITIGSGSSGGGATTNGTTTTQTSTGRYGY